MTDTTGGGFDHLSQGWVLEPITAMTVAAEATAACRPSRVRQA
jgi:hypothetical protein